MNIVYKKVKEVKMNESCRLRPLKVGLRIARVA